MKIKFRLWFVLVTMIIIVLSVTTATFANNPVKILLNGQEINANISSTIINGKTMVPIRNIAEIFEFEVQWNEEEKVVNITDPNSISKQFVVELIEEQGKRQDTGYYFDGLHYELLNIDKDKDLEILARIYGGANIGQFFIFDKSDSSQYKLVTEEDWKVETWNIDTGIIRIDGKKIFELVTRTGGTGARVIYAHLWYMEDGRYVELWRGTLEEMSAFQGEYNLNMGSYRVAYDDGSLYYWQSAQSYRIEGNDIIPKGDVENVMQKYQFVDGKFTILPAKDYNPGS